MSYISNTSAPDCNVVIVSFDTKTATHKCLARLEISREYCHKTLGNNVNIIVVDNNSKDGTTEMIRKRHPNIKLIPLQENIGYARANNIGMNKAAGSYILLLNPDVYIGKHTLVQAIRHMENIPHCDVLGVKLNYPDGSFQPCGGYLPTPLRSTLWALGIESIPVINRMIRPIYQYREDFYNKERQMGWVSGSFMLLRKAVFEKTAGPDPGIFLYMEDVEWCKRIKDVNFQICFTPEISVTHESGLSSHKLSEKELLLRHISGFRLYHEKHYPESAGFVKLVLSAGMKIRAVFYLIVGNRSKARLYWFAN